MSKPLSHLLAELESCSEPHTQSVDKLQELQAAVTEADAIIAAVKKLKAAKGRHHTQIAYDALMALISE